MDGGGSGGDDSSFPFAKCKSLVHGRALSVASPVIFVALTVLVELNIHHNTRINHRILRRFKHKDIGQSTVSEFHLYLEDMTWCCVKSCFDLYSGQKCHCCTQHCWLFFHVAVDDMGVREIFWFISPNSANPSKDSNIPQLLRRTTQ